MPEIVYSASLIMFLRICDVSLGTIRAIWVIESKKIQAGAIGFFEVLIWIFAMRYIVENMDHTLNLIGYAAGFAFGTILGISIEQKLGLGHFQMNVISREKTDLIAQALRKNNNGVTILPGEGEQGEVSIVYTIASKKKYKELKKLVKIIDPGAFINVHPASPSRGYMHGGRK